jgi:hypothetical protein
MKIYTRLVLDMATSAVLEETSFEYSGPIAECKSAGTAPQPVDPYEQAAAQYGLSTGTANYNAALNRPNMTNPLGSTSWNVTGYSGGAPTSSIYPGQIPGSQAAAGTAPSSGSALPDTSAPYLGFGGSGYTGAYSLGGDGYGIPTGAGAPIYTESTQLAPQFESMLEQPIDTSNIPGMPGGPNINQSLDTAENAAYAQQMGYLAPQQALQSEGLDSQLAAEGAAPGSAAYNNAQELLGQQQTFGQQQAAASAIGQGQTEQAQLYSLGGETLQNEITARNAPINEFEALQGSPGATSTAQTPDISGAFGQQYQGALNAYNAGIATNNANTQAGAGLASSALMAYMMY